MDHEELARKVMAHELILRGDGLDNPGLVSDMREVKGEVNDLKVIKSDVRRVVWIVASLLIGGAFKLLFDLASAGAIHRGAAQSQNVNVGKTDSAIVSGRTYFTTAEVAAREGVDERTVLRAIEQGRVVPTAFKVDGRKWGIPRDYAIKPQTEVSVVDGQ